MAGEASIVLSFTFEDTLNAISNGSFPPQGKREKLSPGQKRQLRDAMVFVTHVRERHDIFVTDDASGFINDGRRKYLEGRSNTKILRSEELFDFLLRLSHEDV